MKKLAFVLFTTSLLYCQTGTLTVSGTVSVVGATGITGSTGTNGVNGATGATGQQGPAGVTGPQGLQGIPGPTGATGSGSGTGSAIIFSTVANLPTTGGTNLVTADLTQWSAVGLSATLGSPDPFGGQAAYRLQSTSATSGAQHLRGKTGIAVPAGNYSWKMYFGTTGMQALYVYVDVDNTSRRGGWTINLSSGVIAACNPTDSSFTFAVSPVANSYRQFVATFPVATNISTLIITPEESPSCGVNQTEQVTDYMDFYGSLVTGISSSLPTFGQQYMITDGTNPYDVSVGQGTPPYFVPAVWNGSFIIPTPAAPLCALNSNTSTVSQLVYVGDSILINPNPSYPSQVITTQPFAVTNQGIGGQTTLQMLVAAYNRLCPIYAPLAGYNVAVIEGGVNSLGTTPGPLGTNVSVADFERQLVALHRLAHQIGFKTVATTITPCGPVNAGCGSAVQTKIDTVNAWIRATPFYDALADMAAVPQLQDPTNATYYQQDLQVHFQPAALPFAAPPTANAINQVTGQVKVTVAAIMTPVGTTGNQTINATAGSVRIAAGGTSVTVFDSLITANSVCNVHAATNDATAFVQNVVYAVGSFTIATPPVTTETEFRFSGCVN